MRGGGQYHVLRPRLTRQGSVCWLSRQGLGLWLFEGVDGFSIASDSPGGLLPSEPRLWRVVRPVLAHLSPLGESGSICPGLWPAAPGTHSLVAGPCQG